MAIGDNNNSNLFGTDYNAEEEERKKAELAAQNARIGTVEGTQGSNQQGGFFEPGGFGYENLGPRLVKNAKYGSELLGQLLGEQLYGTGITAEGQATGFPVDRPSLAGDLLTLPGTALNVVGDFVTDPILASVELAKDVASYATGATGVQSQQEALETAQAAAALEATQGVTPPVESLVGDAQGQGMDMNQSAIMNALTDQNQGMDMNQQAIANAQGQGATAPPPAQTLSQFMRYEDAPEQRTEQFLDEQGRLRFRPTQEALRLQAQGEVAQPSTGPVKVPDELMSQVVRTGAQTAEFRDGNRDGIEDREQGIFRPGELIGYDAQGNEVRSPGTQQPVNRIPATAQPSASALSSFEQDSLARQQRIGGTGSFEGDSQAMQDRLRANERQPGESQSDRDTRVAQSRTTGSQTQGMSFDDARRRAEGQLAARGVKNPSASQVNALARGIQAGEPERLEELETQKAINEAKLKTAQATLDRPEFEGKVYTVNGVTFAQTSRGGAQVIDAGTETPQESTAQMKDFVFTLEQIDKAREAFAAGDVDKANDIITAAGIQKNGFDVTASEYFGGSAPSVNDSELTEQQEANITRQAFDTMEEAEAANLPEGTKITIGGRNATV